MNAQQADAALSAQELAAILNVSPATVYRQAQLGDIPSFRVGRVLRFWEHEVRRAIESRDPWRRSNQARARRSSRRAA